MAEVAGPSFSSSEKNVKINDVDDESCEPEKKKAKVDDGAKENSYKLEERLNGILCCAVCLDLPNVAVYQCTNGHLMCAGCFSHLLADARLKDETATCPGCRCDITKTACSRNLAVEKAISELPAECQYCMQQHPRCELSHHERELCQERLVSCKYERIGCPWRGPFHENETHEQSCPHPRKSGDEIMLALQQIDQNRIEEMRLFKNIFSLLSFEKIAFTDCQLRPYRTDDFITKLYYETSRFTAFNLQWVLKARINENEKPSHSIRRTLSYQLVLKSKVPAAFTLHYIALKGPYSDVKMDPHIYRSELSNDSVETPYQNLPITELSECNKVLAAKTINIRLIMFQVQK